jgi:hypothetical protein
MQLPETATALVRKHPYALYSITPGKIMLLIPLGKRLFAEIITDLCYYLFMLSWTSCTVLGY